MATRVYNTEEITLQDDKDVVLKPLPIGRLRRFMEAWNKIGDIEEGDDGFDVFINCCGIALEENFRGDNRFPDGLKASKEEREEGHFLSTKYREYLEDTLELDTIYKILDVSGGIKLNDPKLLEAAMEAAQQESSGRTSN
jgi:hypothetical protein